MFLLPVACRSWAPSPFLLYFLLNFESSCWERLSRFKKKKIPEQFMTINRIFLPVVCLFLSFLVFWISEISKMITFTFSIPIFLFSFILIESLEQFMTKGENGQKMDYSLLKGTSEVFWCQVCLMLKGTSEVFRCHVCLMLQVNPFVPKW